MRLTKLAGSADKFPTFQIRAANCATQSCLNLKGPSPRGSLRPGLIHEERAQRFVRHMAPSDAFVSYVGKATDDPDAYRGRSILSWAALAHVCGRGL